MTDDDTAAYREKVEQANREGEDNSVQNFRLLD